MFAQSVLPPKAGGAPYIHGCTPALTMLFLKWLKSVIFVSRHCLKIMKKNESDVSFSPPLKILVEKLELRRN